MSLRFNAPRGMNNVWNRRGEIGSVVWFTGLSGAGKSTIAALLYQWLARVPGGPGVEMLDGDVMRTQLCSGLGFSRADRDENIRRIGFVCEMLTRHGVTTIVAAISPYRDARERVRRSIPRFLEVFVDCPVPVLIERDPKGLYRRALAHEIHLTGIDDPYERPTDPEVTTHTDRESPEESAAKAFDALLSRGWV